MHPQVRDLYKRVIYVGADYPAGLDYVRQTWKQALRNQENCPSCYKDASSPECEKEILRAVARGRHFVREMIGVIQLKKYRVIKQRYGSSDHDDHEIANAMDKLQQAHAASENGAK